MRARDLGHPRRGHELEVEPLVPKEPLVAGDQHGQVMDRVHDRDLRFGPGLGSHGASYGRPIIRPLDFEGNPGSEPSEVGRGAYAAAAGSSSAQTLNCVRLVVPNDVVRATSTASRPRAISTRPIRGRLWRAAGGAPAAPPPRPPPPPQTPPHPPGAPPPPPHHPGH